MTKVRTRKRVTKPRKIPRQPRSNLMVATILEAAMIILKKHGMGNFNTNAIAEKAGVSVGSLYQYFPSKDAILATLIRQIREEMLADMIASTERKDLGDFRSETRALIEATLQHHVKYADVITLLERAEDDLPMDDDIQEMKQKMLEIVIALLQRHGIENANIVANDIIAICHALSLSIPQSGESNFEELSRRMQRAVFGYIENSTP
ncbi:TetR/AcrR family transcriptional regulator [Cohaesibacter gelatinilyticus]|uniref:Transcriptional regulator, TetR family n=1 Tax=Cohaesibacter gelatinilyticus TaxID=372072 RepID=A0A285PJ10_9HYPH|nr:TetR/AcrR family transcriptional regulator [Cohaesibacter gelatinilyticus]SNZ21263.1 transcriptional regulator, TetR family [Cohaesibacter gelatinilyticus]